MEIESPGMHLEHFHNPENPHPERPEVTEMKKVFAAEGLEFTEIAKQYIHFNVEQLQSIISDCELRKIKNEEFIERLRNSDFSEDEKERHIYQANRAMHYLEHRKKTDELILKSRS